MDSSGKKNSLPNCEWTVTIANCVDQNYYQIIYNITIYLSLIVFLCAVGLLSWRKYSKPEAKLFCIKGFLAMEGFLFTQIFWGMLRVIDCFVLIYDYFPTNMILREMLFTVSWLLGSISVTTYLAGILRTIPRMHFYRQNPEYKSLYLPSIQNTAIIYFCYIFTLGITLTTCSFFIGYLETNPNSIAIAYVLKSVEFSVFAICCFLMSLGYIIYGSKLISIASEGIHLLEGVNDYQSHIKTKNSRNTTHSLSGLELEIKHKKLKRSVRKMRIINISFISSIIILGIILASSAIFCKQLYENLISNKIFAAFTNLFPMLVNVAVMAGIAYGEMRVHNKYEIGFENNITSSISTNNPLPPRESIETIAVHTRDPSTDSESPLLLLPPPVILSTMYHHNHYGGSGGNNGNGNLSNNIRTNNISSNNLRSNNISRNNISSNNVSRNDISSNNISRNDIYRNNNSGRSSFATTTSSLNSPINSTPMRINYSYI